MTFLEKIRFIFRRNNDNYTLFNNLKTNTSNDIMLNGDEDFEAKSNSVIQQNLNLRKLNTNNSKAINKKSKNLKTQKHFADINQSTSNNKKTIKSKKNKDIDSGGSLLWLEKAKSLNFEKSNTSYKYNEDLSKIESCIPNDTTLFKLSNFFSNFADNTRLKIISCLSFGELCVSEIAKVLNMNQTTISHQLAYLKSTGSVSTRRDGKAIYYSLSKTEIEQCLLSGANFISK